MDGLMDCICNGIDKGNKVQPVLLYMSAAFDTISHSILLDRLEEIGITDTLYYWNHILQIEHIEYW